MIKYEVGKVIPEFIGRPQGTLFQITGSGCEVVTFYNRPTPKEIEQFKVGKPFELRFTPLDGVIMMTFKAGSGPWQDAPFSAHLAPNMDLPDEIPEGSGLALTVMLVDSISGEIKSLRLIGLTSKFSRELIKIVRTDLDREFNQVNYFRKVNNIFDKYTTRQLADMSPAKDRFRVR